MRSCISTLLFSAAATLALCAAGLTTAYAGTAAPLADASANTGFEVVPAPDPAAPHHGFAPIGTPLPAEVLVEMRGGEAITTNTVDVAGRVDGNTANNINSGLNVIQDGSFGNSSGITTVIQNSGSNVLIQNGTVVNVQFVDPTP